MLFKRTIVFLYLAAAVTAIGIEAYRHKPHEARLVARNLPAKAMTADLTKDSR
ncbi:hypothetical protein MUY27_14715 [Mucilaginibacter sp. RS28]|uniref:Uncharacterized protein n=1 Tax=Mucilaginibacter straminoryzae TaxID=2932774 RepID=A0A9X1X4V4_9SPHI|nr:hypothetical protein [Mucilaginibacter straminoryzae]MCJ8210968.1 hypothetical protein [Mucilaginibacter straminoryzae]